MKDERYCEYFLEHTKDCDGDDSVFYLTGKLCCDNYECNYDNHNKSKLILELENNPFGLCLSEGLKEMDGFIGNC